MQWDGRGIVNVHCIYVHEAVMHAVGLGNFMKWDWICSRGIVNVGKVEYTKLIFSPLE